jgi:hypothetical protein
MKMAKTVQDGHAIPVVVEMERRSSVVLRVALAAFVSALGAMEIWGPMACLIPLAAYAVFVLLY